MKNFFYEYGQLKWLYALFGVLVGGFLVAFFAAMFSGGASEQFFAIHSGDKWSVLKIWKLITYAVMSTSVFSLVSNLIWLAIFGRILESIYSGKNVVDLFVITTVFIGFLATVFCIFASNNFPIYLNDFTPALIAIATACIYKVPKYEVNLMIIGNVPIWILGAIFLLMRIFMNPNLGAFLMLIISLVAIPIGIFFIKYWEGDVQLKQFSFFQKKKKPSGKVVAMPTSKPKNEDPQEKLNKILEKISANGIENISKEEKYFLENYSRK